MKNIKEILKHLPLPYEKIKIQRCLKLITKGLPQKYEKYISYIYLKGETITFVTKHQAINFELYQKLDNIKTMLKLIQVKMNRCKNIKINNIKAFTINIPKKTEQNRNKKIEQIKFYKQELNGDFQNLAQNKEIYQKFEEIRKIIKAKSQKA